MSNFHLRTWGNQVITCAPVLVPTNMPLRVSACSPAQNAKPVVNRPTADFSPSIWGERFISYTPADEIARAHKEKQVEDLKEKVRRRLITAAGNPSQQLNYIDAIQRLGVAYHFEREIEEALKHMYDNYYDVEHKDDDLYNVSLQFRLLRQQGFNLSCDVFNKFKDQKGGFQESLINDVRGMLGLYEATHIRVREEGILDEALVFTTTHLESAVEHLEYILLQNRLLMP
uniref:Terpene synthase N-terminal domain-containing protein n=1 Tax=Vitis vinifera TaxID=29760 RepID=F6HN07_VITVI